MSCPKRPNLELKTILHPNQFCEVGEELSKIDEFCEHGSWLAILYDSIGVRGHHAVVVGKSAAGNLLIRDPLEGRKYEMTIKEFLGKPLWNGRYIAKTGVQAK